MMACAWLLLAMSDEPGYFLASTSQARDIIGATGADNLFLQDDLHP